MTPTKKQINRALELVESGLRTGGIPGKNFNMEEFCADKMTCGTALCIGGWVSAIFIKAGFAPNRSWNKADINLISTAYDDLLYELFYGFPHGPVSPRQGADAIRRYLRGQKPW